MKEDVAQLRKSLARTVEERNAAELRATDLERRLKEAHAIVCFLVRRAGGTVILKRKTISALRGKLATKENKNGITLTFMKASKKNARN